MSLKFFLSLFTFLLFGQLVAQQNHIIWTIKSEPVSTSSFKVTYSGKIEKDWHVYDANAASELLGVRVTYNHEDLLKTNFEFVTKPANQQDVIFKTLLPVFTDSVVFTDVLNFKTDLPAAVRVTINADVAKLDEFLPEEFKETVQLSGNSSAAGSASSSQAQSLTSNLKVAAINLEKPLSAFEVDSAYATDSKSSSLLTIFLLGFFGGLIALLTPCVFPMIPLTVSFFTKKSQSKQSGIRNASLYGFFILLIYVLLSVPFHFIENIDPQILNNISTNVYLNLIFFVVFVVFALSFSILPE